MTSVQTQRLRYLLLFVLSVWALVSVGFRYLLADLNSYLVEIEKLVEQKTPYKITIDQISGRWLLYSPVIELKGVALANKIEVLASAGSDSEGGDSEGADSERSDSEGTLGNNSNTALQEKAFLHIDRVSVELDLFESLLFFKPRLRALLIDGLRVSLRQDTDNKKIQVVGLANSEPENIDPEKQKLLLESIINDYVLSTGQIYLKNAHIKFDIEKIPRGELTIDGLVLDNEWFNHLLLADVWLNDGSGVLRTATVKTQFQGSPLDIESFSARGFLGVDFSDLSYWTQSVRQAGLSLNHLEAGFGLWVEIRQGELESISTDVKLKNVEIGTFHEQFPQYISQLDFSINALGSVHLKSLLEGDFTLENFSRQWELKAQVSKLFWGGQEYRNLILLFDNKLVSDTANPLAKGWSDFDFIEKSPDGSGLESEANTMFRFSMNYLPLSLLYQGSYLVEALSGYKALIEEMSIQGRIESIQAIVIKDKSASQPRIYASAKVKNLGFQEFNKIPALNGIDFYVEVAPHVVGVVLEVKNAKLSMSEHLFRGDVLVNSLEGNILLEKIPNDIVIHSDFIKASAEGLEGGLKFSASIPERFYADGSKEAPSWSIQAHLDAITFEKGRIFFPSRLPTGFLDWIDVFLKNGHVDGDIFLFAFTKKRLPDTFITLAADLSVHDAQLDYLPGKWPMLEAVSGKVQVHNDEVKASVSEAKLFEARLYNGQLFIPSYLNENLPRVKISCEAAGSLEDLQKLFLNSELKDSIGSVVVDWKVTGNQTAKIDFDLPISDQIYPEPAKVEAYLDIVQASIFVPDVELGVYALQGDIHYSLAKGLSAESFQGTLFEKPISGHIDTVRVGKQDVIQVFAKSSIEQKDLAQWQDLWLFNNISGQSDFSAVLSVGEKASIEKIVPTLGKLPKGSFKKDNPVSQIQKKSKSDLDPGVEKLHSESEQLKGKTIVRASIDSDLKGMSVSFPGSYSKQKKDVRPTRMQLDVLPEALVYRVDYNNEVKLAMKTVDNEIERGLIHFGEGIFHLPLDKGLTVTGNVSSFDFDEWYDYLEKNILDDDPAASSENSVIVEDDPAAIVNKVDVIINHFTGFGLKLENLKTLVVRGDKNWHIDVQNEVLAGYFIVPDEELISRDNPIIAELEYLKVSDSIFSDATISVKDSSSKADKNSQSENKHVVLESEVELKPEDFTFVKLKVTSVTLDGAKHGRWEIDIFPDEKGMDFDVHQLNYGLMAINGKGRWDYNSEKSVSKFKGHVRTAAVTRLFTAFDLTPSAKSKGLMAIDIYWPGDPFSFDSEIMKGTAGLEVFDGSIIEIDIKSKKFTALGIFNLGFVNDIITLKVLKKIGQKLIPDNSSTNKEAKDAEKHEGQSTEDGSVDARSVEDKRVEIK